MSYFISETYVPRLNNDFFDDTSLRDECQKEVYEYARKIADRHNVDRVTDVGCGSAYKLLKNFYDFDTCGVDMPDTVTWLRKMYPTRGWYDFGATHTMPHTDLAICADVIEHVVNPDELLAYIVRMKPEVTVFSTPERLRLEHIQSEWRADGPPVNPCHVREWSFDEFEKYVASYFRVDEHLISNESQATQVIVCSLR